MKKCVWCKSEITGSNPVVTVDGLYSYCKECTGACERMHYDGVTPLSELYAVGGERWCTHCANNYSASCYHCGARVDIVNLQEAMWKKVGRTDWCADCFASKYWLCPCSSAPIGSGQVCEVCEKDVDGKPKRCMCGYGSDAKPIHVYSCKPKLVFHGKSKQKIHMGFELETQINGGRSDDHINIAAVFAKNILQPLEIAQLKNDSSIGGGFEIVTQPHTYEKYRDDSQVLWDTIDTLRKRHNARSWDAGTCGLHIHISRQAFRDGLHLHRFIEFIYRNPEMLMKFAGRNSSRYATFADCWATDEYERPFLNFDSKLKNRNTTRGSAVNVQNEHTIELRFFRGTMRPSGVRSALGLAHAMVQYTRTMVPDVEAPREQVFAWEPLRAWVEERASEYPDLMERMPLIKDVNLNDIPNIDA